MGPLSRAALLAATATLVACGGNKLTQSGHSGSGSTGTIGSTGHLISSTTGGHGSTDTTGTGTSATTGSSSGTAGTGSTGSASTTAGSTSASSGTSATTTAGSTGTSSTTGTSGATTGGGDTQVELLPGAQHMSSPGHQLELRLTPQSRATMGAPGGHKLKVGVVPPDVP